MNISRTSCETLSESPMPIGQLQSYKRQNQKNEWPNMLQVVAVVVVVVVAAVTLVVVAAAGEVVKETGIIPLMMMLEAELAHYLVNSTYVAYIAL